MVRIVLLLLGMLGLGCAFVQDASILSRQSFCSQTVTKSCQLAGASECVNVQSDAHVCKMDCQECRICYESLSKLTLEKCIKTGETFCCVKGYTGCARMTICPDK